MQTNHTTCSTLNFSEPHLLSLVITIAQHHGVPISLRDHDGAHQAQDKEDEIALNWTVIFAKHRVSLLKKAHEICCCDVCSSSAASAQRRRRTRTISAPCRRRFRLPENAKVEEVKAGLKNGVLTVTVPKAEIKKKPEVKAIEISG